MQINTRLSNLTQGIQQSQGMRQSQNMQGSMSPPPAATEELSEIEEETIDDVLKSYDADDFSEDDEEELLVELEEAGITINMATIEYLEDSGFEMSKPEGIGGDFSSGNIVQLTSDQQNEISDLIGQYNDGDLDEDEFQAELESTIESFMSKNGANFSGGFSSGQFINRAI